MFVRQTSRYWPLLLALLAGLAWAQWRPKYLGTRLTFMQVGQGDCTVIQVGGKTILVDAGPRSDIADAGATLVVPKLYALGVDRIDAVILSHSDMDHIGGLISVSRHFAIHEVIYPAGCAHDRDLQWVLQRCTFGRHRTTEGTEEIQLGSARIELSTPPVGQFGSTNDNSIFAHFSVDGATVLLTGDASFDAEDAMLKRGRVRPAQILHAGHHGAKKSTSEELLDAVNPDIVVISCGRHNSYGHPAPGTLFRIDESGAETLRTDRDGDVTMVPRGGRWLHQR